MALNNTLLSDGVTDVYTSTGMNVIVAGFFCNTHDSPVSITVYLLPAGQTADDTYKIYNSLTIAPGDTYILDTEKIILDTGEKLAAVATVTDKIAATLITMAL